MDKCTKFSVNLKTYDLMAQHQAIFKYIFILSRNLNCFLKKMGENDVILLV